MSSSYVFLYVCDLMIHVLRSLLMVVHLKRGRTLGPELYHFD